jgi:hypothetical protein
MSDDVSGSWQAGLSPTPPPPPTAPLPPLPLPVDTMTRLRGVRGWLLFFCLSLTLLNPGATVYNLYNSIPQSAPYFRAFPGLFLLAVVDTVVSAGIAALSVYAGILLWRVRPGAVRVTRIFLIVGMVYVVIAPFTPLLAGLPQAVNDAVISAVPLAIGRGILYYAIWLGYLSSSKRVRATYSANVVRAYPPPPAPGPSMPVG